MLSLFTSWNKPQETVTATGQPAGSDPIVLQEEQLNVAQQALETSGKEIAEKVTQMPAQPKEESEAGERKKIERFIKGQKWDNEKQAEQIREQAEQIAVLKRKVKQYEANLTKSKEVQLIQNSESTTKKSTDFAKELEKNVETVKKVLIHSEKGDVNKVKEKLKKLEGQFSNLLNNLEKSSESIKTQISLRNDLIGNWNSSKLNLEKSLSFLNWLKDSLHLPVNVEFLLKNILTLKGDIEKESSDNYKSVDQQKLVDLQNICRDLLIRMEELKDKEKLFDLLVKVKEKIESDNSQRKDEIISALETSKEADKESALNSLTSIFNSEKENYSALCKKTTDSWNQAVEELWLIGTILASLKISVNHARPLEDLKDKLKVLSQEARDEIIAYANSEKKKEDLEEKLKAHDKTFLELLNVKAALEKEYLTIKEDSGKLTQSEQKSLEFYALNSGNSKEIEAKQIVLHKQHEESQIKTLSDLEALWNITNELIHNAARQLDKFVTAYNNNGVPKYSWMQKITASDSYYQEILKDPTSAKSFFEKPAEVTAEKQ